MCFGCSKELSHRDGSFEYAQHMFWMRNKENSFPIHALIWSPGVWMLYTVIYKVLPITFLGSELQVNYVIKGQLYVDYRLVYLIKLCWQVGQL